MTMMNFDFARNSINRYRLWMGALFFVSVALFAQEDMQGYGLLIGTLTAVLLPGGGFHPSHGLLMSSATSFKQALLHAFIYFLCVLGLGWIMLSGPHGFEGPFSRIGSAAAVILLVTLLPRQMVGMLVVRRWGRTPQRHIMLGFLAVTSALCLVIGMFAASNVITALGGVTRPHPGYELLRWVPVATVLVLVLSLWVRDTVVSRWQTKLDEQGERAREAERGRRVAEAQLAMLQAQIEPHFLYNTLASVQYLVRRDANGADFLLNQLIRYLRQAMPKMRRPMSTLEQEFELADAFLQIARMRMGGRLAVRVELVEQLHAQPFPPLVLQTLVENALKHGVEPKLGPVSIIVRAGIERMPNGTESLALEVGDNGVGLGKANTAGSGSGLANIRERLVAIYGCGAALTVSDAPEGGVISRVVLELQRPSA
jgi:Histidine kinase